MEQSAPDISGSDLKEGEDVSPESRNRFDVIVDALVNSTKHLESLNVKMDQLIDQGTIHAQQERTCASLQENIKTLIEAGKDRNGRVMAIITLFLVGAIATLAGVKWADSAGLLNWLR